MTQLEILSAVPVPPETKLTARQRFALETVGRYQPIPSDELGAHLCARRGKHAADVRCEWCSRAGREVGAALRKKGLVRLRREQGWVLAGYRPSNQGGKPEADGYDPETSEIPF